jgi:GR25 family glycosyltransferase involved in LPS biosynthesis
MLHELFDAIYVVNLPSSTARRESIKHQFSRLGVDHYHLVDAIDGNTLDLAALKSQGVLQNEKLSPGEIGCYLTHIQVYRDILQGEHETALVCEDDIIFSSNAKELFSDYMQRMPPDWDIIHFYSSRPISGGDPNDKKRIRVKDGIYRGFNEGRGAVCLALRRRCLKYLLTNAFPITSTIDGKTNWPTLKREEGLNGYIVSPFPCGFGDFGSEIDKRGTRQAYREKRVPFKRVFRLLRKLVSSSLDS